MKIAIGNDHGGVELKKHIVKYLEENGHEVINYGSDTNDRVDYPVYGFKVGEAVGKGLVDYGIAICKSAIGMSVACNKVKGVRCGAIYSVDDAKHAKHNDYINTIALNGKNISIEDNIKIVEAFLKAENNIADPTYLKRKNQIVDYENRGQYDC